MKRFCTDCGKEIAEGVAFCTECGTPAPQNKPVEQLPEKSVQHTVVQTPVQLSTPVAEQNKAVGTGTYFGLLLLFALPVIGFIACLIMAITSKNKNLKNFAKAVLIWTIIGLIITGVITVAVVLLGNALTNYINTETGSQFNEFGSLFGELNEYNEIMDQIQNGGLETLPTE